MNSLIKLFQTRRHRLLSVILANCFLIFCLKTTAQTSSTYSAIPPTISDSTQPLIMLALSVDHQLFFKSFTDYDDIDGDGVIDTTYKNDIDYAGYFDSYKCYVYNGAYFTPEAITETKYCNEGVNDQWSGNFLNWATMTRIDQVRSIFYGGTRYVDTSTQTILERSYLPNDAHSFAKYYNGFDLEHLTPFSNADVGVGDNEDPDNGITICNTTRYSGTQVSQYVVNDPPLARVVDGNYKLWAANERWQCLYSEEASASNGNNSANSGIFAYSSNPSIVNQAVQADGNVIGDYAVRVEACVDGLINTEDCREYPDGNTKPAGLLQSFGEDDDALWGLMSGTYLNNKSGGVLRKDLGTMTDEINVDSDGTFITPSGSGGIIASIDAMRISNYSYNGGGLYNTTDSCGFGLSSFSNGACTNWGNPFAEILLECYRYFAGETSGDFAVDDSTLGGALANLGADNSWNNPQTTESACASLNVVAINANSNSYDNDEFSGFSDLGADLGTVGGNTVLAWTNEVGNREGITNNYYFVGENGTDNNQLCTGKQVTGFGSALGNCPNAPRLSGSFNAAGLAFAARTTDLRSFEGEQYVDTYGVTLSPGVPNISVQVPGSAADPQYVSILPACRNNSVGGNCGLVDFQVVSAEDGDPNDDTSIATGAFYVIWEDSEQGGDFDQDMAGVIRYSLSSTTLQISTQVFAQSTPNSMGFGYIVSGTSMDGYHVHSGINSYSYDSVFSSAQDCGEAACSCRTNTSFGACTIDNATSQSLPLGSSTAALLEQPLYYASKWGSFIGDPADDGTLADSQWDFDGDGSPDNYILATNPIEVKERLSNLFESLLEGSASGTAAAVNAQTGRGVGAIYQAIYTPTERQDDDFVDWVGNVRSFFLDQRGRLREDQEGDGVLQTTDRALVFRFDDDLQNTVVDAYNVNTDGSTGDLDATFDSDSDDLKPVWDALTRLDAVDQYTENRSYTDPAESGRYIFTAIDRDGDGLILSPDYTANNPGQNATDDSVFAFLADNFDQQGNTQDDYRYFDLDLTADEQDVFDLVNYIRGEPVDGLRDRVLDGGEDSADMNLILGDIVHSTPVVVSRPADRYDILYRDDSYVDYLDQYDQRRVMVYVGANDGMLHAFNGGNYDPATFTYSADENHQLGDEMWAYVPYNVLPHLKWLTEEDYPHVYYVDGAAQAFDVNIFPATGDPTHPNGWGTILVVGMRFGGGDYSFDHDGDPDTDDITTRSAYIVLDVTDPEQPPTLLAEITHPDLGYALSQPEIVKYRAPQVTGTYVGTDANAWYLVFGSGPAGNDQTERNSALQDAQSYKTAKTFVYDLINETLDVYDHNEADSFVGGYEAADWDVSYADDAVYFGTVSGTAAAPAGKLKRGALSFDPITNALSIDFSNDLFNDSGLAFSATPRVFRNSKNEYWIYAGTGRFLTQEDNLSTQQQMFYGIKDEPLIVEVDVDNYSISFPSTVRDADLVNVTDVEVFDDGRVFADGQQTLTLSAGSDTGTEVTTFDGIVSYIEDHDGWKFAFEYPVPYNLNNAVRNTTQAGLAGASVAVTAYEPTGMVCDVIGNGLLYTPHHGAGVPAPFAPLGTDSSIRIQSQTGGDDNELVLQGALIGRGAPSDPVITRPTQNPNADSAICPDGSTPYVVTTNTATGELSQTYVCPEGMSSGRRSWREIPINW